MFCFVLFCFVLFCFVLFRFAFLLNNFPTSDTEGSFMPERMQEIAAAAVEHVHCLAEPEDAGLTREFVFVLVCVCVCECEWCAHMLKITLSCLFVCLFETEHMAAVKDFDTSTVLARIHYFRVHDCAEQLALFHLLPEFCKEHPNVSVLLYSFVFVYYIIIFTRIFCNVSFPLLLLFPSSSFFVFFFFFLSFFLFFFPFFLTYLLSFSLQGQARGSGQRCVPFPSRF